MSQPGYPSRKSVNRRVPRPPRASRAASADFVQPVLDKENTDENMSIVPQPGEVGESIRKGEADPKPRPPPVRKTPVRRQSKSKRIRHKEHKFKVLVVGNSKCGKTSMIARYAADSFSGQYNITIGADYTKKIVKIDDNNSARLQLWDIAGQDRFAAMTRPYYRGANAALIVCDVSRSATLQAIRDWKLELDDKVKDESGNSIPAILIANKCDLLTTPAQGMAVGAEIESLVRELNFDRWFITSAKDNQNVEESMAFLVKTLMDTQGGRSARRNKSPKRGGLKLGNSTTLMPDETASGEGAMDTSEGRVDDIAEEAENSEGIIRLTPAEMKRIQVMREEENDESKDCTIL